MPATGEPLLVQVSDGVATLTLNRPERRNALSRRLLADLSAAVGRLAGDPGVRVLVLTGAGPVFCSGADLREDREPGTRRPVAALPELLTALWTSAKPVVARVNGPARAGGIGLIAACDIAVADRAATFAFTEVRIGVVPAVISVVCLRRMAVSDAHELLLTGEVFDAARARSAGLLTAAVPAAELDAAVDRYVDALLRGAPAALAATKRLTRAVPAWSLEEGFAEAGRLSAEFFGSADAAEGIRAFAEKRDAGWVPQGRRRAAGGG
jgi:methylglutaconyl-CoA hydratase